MSHHFHIDMCVSTKQSTNLFELLQSYACVNVINAHARVTIHSTSNIGLFIKNSETDKAAAGSLIFYISGYFPISCLFSKSHFTMHPSMETVIQRVTPITLEIFCTDVINQD